MPYNPNKHHRRSIRLKGYDYSKSGAYFITICTQNRESLFGNVVNHEMVLNEFGKIVEFTWHDLPNHNSNIQLDEFIIMPNRTHGIIIINDKNTITRNNPPIKNIFRQTNQSNPKFERHFRLATYLL